MYKRKMSTLTDRIVRRKHQQSSKVFNFLHEFEEQPRILRSVQDEDVSLQDVSLQATSQSSGEFDLDNGSEWDTADCTEVSDQNLVCDNWSNDQDWIDLAKEPESSGNKKARTFKEHLASWLVDCKFGIAMLISCLKY